MDHFKWKIYNRHHIDIVLTTCRYHWDMCSSFWRNFIQQTSLSYGSTSYRDFCWNQQWFCVNDLPKISLEIGLPWLLMHPCITKWLWSENISSQCYGFFPERIRLCVVQLLPIENDFPQIMIMVWIFTVWIHFVLS